MLFTISSAALPYSQYDVQIAPIDPEFIDVEISREVIPLGKDIFGREQVLIEVVTIKEPVGTVTLNSDAGTREGEKQHRYGWNTINGYHIEATMTLKVRFDWNKINGTVNITWRQWSWAAPSSTYFQNIVFTTITEHGAFWPFYAFHKKGGVSYTRHAVLGVTSHSLIANCYADSGFS